MQYRISEIFSSVQGEGCNTGISMVIVRLQGCNIRCSWCDTKYTWPADKGKEMSEEEIVQEVKKSAGPRWIMLTGGEPTMQNLGPLCEALHKVHYRIALETNGTLPLQGRVDWLCMSPKLQVPGGSSIDRNILLRAEELKFVIHDQEGLNAVDEFLAKWRLALNEGYIQICLQPESGDPDATQFCYETCIQRGWRLSIQLHKLISVR